MLSAQTQRLSDAWGAGTVQPLFNYNSVYAAKDKAAALDDKYAVTTRAVGAAQAVGGATTIAASYGGAATACKLSFGLGCAPATVAGTVGATYGADNLNAGAKALVDGKPYATWGAQVISDTFGIPLDSAELLYSVPSMAQGGKTLAQGSMVAGKTATEFTEKAIKQTDEAFARGTHIKLGEDKYTYVGDSQFIGPNGGKVINTGQVDSLTGNQIYQRVNSDGSLGNEFYMMSAEGKQIKVDRPDSLKSLKQVSNNQEIHHICTDKNCISASNGGPWTPRFEVFFNNADLSMQSELNKVLVKGHQGPHPVEYHSIIYDRLSEATQGLSPKSIQYKNAVESTLEQLKIEISTPDTKLNKLVRGEQ